MLICHSLSRETPRQTGENVINSPRFQEDEEYARRATSAIYMLYILANPLHNGNGQATTNMISALLYNAGYRQGYFKAFLDGRMLRDHAFENIPYEGPTATIEEYENRDEVAYKQTYGENFIRNITSNEVWPVIREFIETGKIPDYNKFPRRGIVMNNAPSFLSRTNKIYQQLRESLSSAPIGTRELTYSQMLQAEPEIDELYSRFQENPELAEGVN